jgi:hypothetical protein
MRHYVVFDQESGRIVHAHTHMADADLHPDAIAALVGAKFDRRRLKVMPIKEPMEPGVGYRVNLKTAALEKADKSPGGGGGGAVY